MYMHVHHVCPAGACMYMHVHHVCPTSACMCMHVCPACASGLATCMLSVCTWVVFVLAKLADFIMYILVSKKRLFLRSTLIQYQLYYIIYQMYCQHVTFR